MIENGNADIKSLTSEQLEKYEFKVKVTEGSSGLEDNLPEILRSMAEEAFGKMNGVEAAVTVLGLAVIVACGWGFLSYLQNRKETRLEEIRSHERLRTIESFNATSNGPVRRPGCADIQAEGKDHPCRDSAVEMEKVAMMKRLPCPFCGAEGPLQRDEGPRTWVLYCPKCGADGPPGETPGEADEKWNARADQSLNNGEDPGLIRDA